MKKIFSVLVGSAFLLTGCGSSDSSDMNERRVNPAELPIPTQPSTAGTDDEVISETFSGTLEKVDTGCFADGECFVEVDGKHVTAIMGWSQETVGSIKGVDGFGDLESVIGQTVEVHARFLEPEFYTLYGNEDYYISANPTE